MESLAVLLSSGWASGVNAYMVVLVLGVAQRCGVDGVPEVLGRPEVIAVAAVLYALEFVVDKIPYVDSAWDAISTVVRPLVGATVAVLLAGEAGSIPQAAAAAVGGGVALAAHVVKAGGRLALNASPEPVTNVTASVLEDVAVLAVLWLAFAYPMVAAGVVSTLLVLGIVVVYAAWKTVGAGWRRWRTRRKPVPVGA